MALSLNDLLALCTLAALLALSWVTVAFCRKLRSENRSEGAFLFEGLGRHQSLASNTGAVFSVTYFFGATFIYAAVFNDWIRVIAVVVFVIFTAIAIQVVRILYERGYLSDRSRDHSPLLACLSETFSPRAFRDVIALYLIIYFGLLVEELAVTRLVLHSLLPHPVIVAVLVAVIAFVIYTYLYLGGFRAVLIADTVQTSVLVAFLLVLVFIVVRDASPKQFAFGSLPRLQPLSIGNLVGGGVFVVAWCLSAVDYYSRLNFSHHGGASLPVYRRFVVTSAVATFTVIFIGATFGKTLTAKFAIESPSSYAQHAVQYFVSQPLLIASIFLVSLFAMIFTTIDTLLVVLLQVGFYSSKGWIRRGTLLNVLLLAVVISTQIGFDAVSAVGVFLGSLLVLPALAIARSLWPATFAWLPQEQRYLLYSALLAAAIFAFRYTNLEKRFDRHFYLALLTLGCGLAAAGGVKLINAVQQRLTTR